MGDINSLSMLVQKKQAKLDSFAQQKQAVEDKLGSLSGDVSAAQVTVGDKQMALSEAVVTLSNFTIPEIIDKPDRASFTSVDAETGEEVFDSAAFNAENEKYQESVKAHDEAVIQKKELEDAVKAKTQELAGAEADYKTLVQTAQDKENELSAINSDMNMSMSEIEDLNSQIAELEKAAKEEAEAEDAASPKSENENTYIDPKTGNKVTETIIDGKVVKSVTVNPDNPNEQTITEFNEDGVVVTTNTDNGDVTNKYAVSQDGNVAEYDGNGNTVITVKAGESANIIYNKFFGKNEENAQNRANLIEQFKQDAIQSGKELPEGYNPTDAELKQFFFKVSGFNADGTRLTNGKIVQAGQSLTIPTEIHPDDANLQNRDAKTEKAKGNAAEIRKQERIKAAKEAEEAAKAAEEAAKAAEEEYQQLSAELNDAQKSFDDQKKKDGWAAKTADKIAHLWNNDLIELTGNTSSMVQRDLDAYNEKLSQLKEALDSGDMDKFNKLRDELKSNNVGERVAGYNDSQDKGASTVKTAAVVAASTVAAVATGGSSLIVQAGVAGTVAATARFGAEVSDLATNDVDGDINSESLTQIGKQAAVEGVVAAATAGVAKGIGNYLSKGAGSAATSESGLALLKAGGDDAGALVLKAGAESADDVGALVLKAGAESADDVGGAIVKGTVKSAGNAAKSAMSEADAAVLSKMKISSNDISFIDSLPSRPQQWSQSMKNKVADMLGINASDIGNLSTSTYRKLALKFHPDRYAKESDAIKDVAERVFSLINNIR